MTFFLKSKIKAQQQKVANQFTAMLKSAEKYDNLVLEYQNENSFMQPNQQRAPSIMISILQGMISRMGLTPQQQQEQPQPVVSNPIQTTQPVAQQPAVSQPTNQTNSSYTWSDERKKAFAEKMRVAREKSKKMKGIEDMEV